MKIVFDKDNSFIELFPTDDGKVSFVMCGRKSYKEVTMASAELSPTQVHELVEFLKDWLEKN